MTLFAQDCFDRLGYFLVSCIFKDFFFSISVKNVIGILMMIALTLYIASGNIAIFFTFTVYIYLGPPPPSFSFLLLLLIFSNIQI